jgi:hypothetical protein
MDSNRKNEIIVGVLFILATITTKIGLAIYQCWQTVLCSKTRMNTKPENF